MVRPMPAPPDVIFGVIVGLVATTAAAGSVSSAAGAPVIGGSAGLACCRVCPASRRVCLRPDLPAVEVWVKAWMACFPEPEPEPGPGTRDHRGTLVPCPVGWRPCPWRSAGHGETGNRGPGSRMPWWTGPRPVNLVLAITGPWPLPRALPRGHCLLECEFRRNNES